jgi:hypothetical protein
MIRDSLKYQIENYYAIQDSQLSGLLYGIFGLAGFSVMSYDFVFTKKMKSGNVAEIILIIFFLLVGVMFIYKVVKPTIHLIMDKYGIWINGKGKFSWENMEYFSFEEKQGYMIPSTIFFIYKLKEFDNPFKLIISGTTGDPEMIRHKINTFKGKIEISDFGTKII